jgi:hypothetical protein
LSFEKTTTSSLVHVSDTLIRGMFWFCPGLFLFIPGEEIEDIREAVKVY